MKNWKLSVLLNTPLGVMIAVGAVVLGAEFLFMTLLHELLIPVLPFELSQTAWDVTNAVTTTALVAPVLYFLVFRKMHESEERFRQTLATAPNAIVIVDGQGRITDWNHTAQKMFQYSEEEAVGRLMHQLIAPPRFHADALRGFARFEETGGGPLLGKVTEIVAVRKDGSEFPVELSLSALKLKGRWHAIGIIHDIAERKRTEEATQESEQRLRFHAENSPMAVVEWDANFVVTRWSGQAEKMFGWSQTETIGKQIMDLKMIYEDDIPIVQNTMQRLTDGVSKYVIATNRNYTKDGKVIDCEWYNSILNNSQGKMISVMSQVLDITERKRAEKKLRESQEKIQKIFDSSPDVIYLIDLNGIVTECNQTTVNLHGYSTKEELLGTNGLNLVVENERQRAMELLGELVSRGTMHNVELTMLRKDGSQFMGEAAGSVLRDSSGKPTGSVVIMADITRRKQAEDTLRESEARYRRITEGLTDYQYTVRVENGRAVETTQSQACALVTGYAAEEYAANPHLWIQMVVPEDRERVLKHANQILAGDDVSPIEHRITRKNGETRWISDTTIPFRDASGKLLSYDGIIKDITEHKRLEKESLEAAIRLKDGLTDAIGAIAATLEQRDPYTAGHQRRVAELAVAIAEEMRLAREVIEGLHFGGLIHDIGKISVPAEILGKPGRITDIEFSLIKIHAEAGYQIVKEINFPWPVADMVCQHHERLDGSGYPQGFKGEQIVLEARILAVADVVEAISANRPYRPGLGLDVALDEISRGRGTLFDPVVVDACLRVIKEKGFVFTK